MSIVTVSRLIARPRDEVFAALADFGGIHRFHPLVERSPVNADTKETGLGAERTCHFYDGNHIQERVVEFQQDSVLGVDIYDGTMPLASAAARFVLSSEGDNTRVEMTMDYTPKFGIVGQAMNALVMKRKFTGMVTLLLAALDEHLRTGEVIGPEWRPSAAA